MTTIAMRNGAVGCVCDSQIRDTVQIIEMGFPVYYTGIRPLDSQGRARVMAYDVPVRCGDVLVHPQDLVFADHDGIVVIPTGGRAGGVATGTRQGRQRVAGARRFAKWQNVARSL